MNISKSIQQCHEAVDKVWRKYDLFWSPEGRKIATVEASSMKLAKRKAPKPYRKYLGEIYAQPVEPESDMERDRR